MIVQELWSEEDEAKLERFTKAAREGDLVGALFALEGAGDEEEERRLLLRWGEEVASRLPPNPAPLDQAQALAEVLASEADLRGDTSVWGKRWSSGLREVLSRRRGLPILLAAIWMEVGRIAGLSVSGIGLPGHFVVQIGGKDGVFADPYGGGRPLDEDDCRELVEKATGGRASFSPSYLEPREIPQILERVIQNLLALHERKGEREELYRLLVFRAALLPDKPEPLLQQAQVARALGAPLLARKGLEEVARRFAGTREAEAAAAELARMQPPLLH